MSSQPLGNTEKARRKRQSRNNKNASATPASADETGSMDSNPDVLKPKPTHKKKNQKNTTESALSQQIAEDSGAATPPRRNAKSTLSNDVDGQNGQKSSRKKASNQIEHMTTTPGPKRQKAQNANTNGASNNNNNTPGKPILEAAYAGPTFHASPAPSALPIPKFLSRSAPPNDQDVGINARLAQEEDTGSGSDQGPPSPSQHLSVKASATSNAIPAPTLFDMLINADRQEKARQRAPQDQAHSHAEEQPQNLASNVQRPKHSRTLTAGSVFPMDIEALSGRSTPASIYHQSAQPARQESPAPNGNFTPTGQPRPFSSNDDNLKRMLFSSPQNVPHGQTHMYSGPPHSSPAWGSSPASRNNTPPYGTPSPASSVSGLAASSRPAPASPYAQMSPSPAARRNQYPQNNSSLRREVSPGQLNLYGSPPYSHGLGFSDNPYFHNSSPVGSPTYQRFPVTHQYLGGNSPYGSQGNNSPARNHSPAASHIAPSSARFSAQDALKASLGKDSSSGSFNATGMENELRKILRLDDLRATSATAPPS